MLDGIFILRENPQLRSLLEAYRARKTALPDAEWHDRVMEMGNVDSMTLVRLHGLLLANGWIETRVDRESFAQPGILRCCYRASPEGLRALRLFDDMMLGRDDDGWDSRAA